MCDGCLVLHRDGLVAYCSEELDGGLCAGYETAHRGGVMECRITLASTRCGHCDNALRRTLTFAALFVVDETCAYVN
jgi:hypothetical protein